MGAGPLRKDLVTGQAPQSLAGGWQVPQVGSAYRRFRLMLMVNHACNMRCTYCYRTDKVDRPMPEQVERKAIDRAIASLASGGTLELSFFGGEPLLEAPLIAALIGNDTHSNPMRLSGGVLDGEDFLRHGTRACRSVEACAACTVRSFCTATWPRSNYARIGNAGRPGGLLRFLNDSCRREAARVLSVFPHGVKT